MKTIDFANVNTHPKTTALQILDSVIGGGLMLLVFILIIGITLLLK